MSEQKPLAPREFWLRCFVSTGWDWTVADENPGFKTYPRETDYDKDEGHFYQIHVREVDPKYDEAVAQLVEAAKRETANGCSGNLHRALAEFEKVKK